MYRFPVFVYPVDCFACQAKLKEAGSGLPLGWKNDPVKFSLIKSAIKSDLTGIRSEMKKKVCQQLFISLKTNSNKLTSCDRFVPPGAISKMERLYLPSPYLIWQNRLPEIR